MHRVGEKAENQWETREKSKCSGWISASKKDCTYTFRTPSLLLILPGCTSGWALSAPPCERAARAGSDPPDPPAAWPCPGAAAGSHGGAAASTPRPGWSRAPWTRIAPWAMVGKKPGLKKKPAQWVFFGFLFFLFFFVFFGFLYTVFAQKRAFSGFFQFQEYF